MKRTISCVVLTSMLATSIGFAGDKKDKKKDPEAIGDRDVGKGVNFYSIEKEIGVGKSLAQDIERQAKMIDDPVIGAVRQQAPFPRVVGVPPAAPAGAPRLGAHTDEVLSALGLSAAEIDGLREKGVV